MKNPAYTFGTSPIAASRLEEIARFFNPLALDFCLEARFAHGDIDPDKCTDGCSPYSALKQPPEAFDLIFVYPWPTETRAVFDLFERVAGEGAYLISYHGIEDIRCFRKGDGRTSGEG